MSLPQRIRNDREQQELLLEWQDGRQQRIAHATLRRQCRCAFCRARQLRGEILMVEEGLQLTGMQAQGYGLQLVFSDGHDKGIFPWAYLAALA